MLCGGGIDVVCVLLAVADVTLMFRWLSVECVLCVVYGVVISIVLVLHCCCSDVCLCVDVW